MSDWARSAEELSDSSPYAALIPIPEPPESLSTDHGHDWSLGWSYDENPPDNTYSREFVVREWRLSPDGGRWPDITVYGTQVAKIDWDSQDRAYVTDLRIDGWGIVMNGEVDLPSGDAARHKAEQLREVIKALREAADELEARTAAQP
jgi:hypothetical protein